MVQSYCDQQQKEAKEEAEEGEEEEDDDDGDACRGDDDAALGDRAEGARLGADDHAVDASSAGRTSENRRALPRWGRGSSSRPGLCRRYDARRSTSIRRVRTLHMHHSLVAPCAWRHFDFGFRQILGSFSHLYKVPQTRAASNSGIGGSVNRVKWQI